MLDELRARLTPKHPAERERLKRIAVYTVLCLSCLVCIWLIFAPGGDDETAKGKANTELPDGTTDGMPQTKIQAYQQDEDAKERASQQANLVQLSESLDTIQKPQTDTVPDAIQNSADAYQQAQASLQDFYIPETSEADLQVAELQERIAELEMQNSIAQQSQQPDQMKCLNAHISLQLNTWATAATTTIHNLRLNRKKRANGTYSQWHRSTAMLFPHCRQHLQGLSTPPLVANLQLPRTLSPQWWRAIRAWLTVRVSNSVQLSLCGSAPD